MHSLRERLLHTTIKTGQTGEFLTGVELVSTRGTMADRQAVEARRFATDLSHSQQVDWVSITDNAGGNPQLSPMALGKPILYAGKEVLIHLSCKDFNRNAIESAAWELASEGFQNILALSGDYPAAGFNGRGKPVFDIDSVGLLTMLGEMNRGLSRPRLGTIQPTNFFCGAVATNFKRHENEVVPQLLKLDKKIECGAQFIIAQIGFDARKSHELLCYINDRVPLIGNVYLLTDAVARFFRRKTIPGVVISDALAEQCERYADSARFFIELAAKQLAIFRGLGFAGGYLGGVDTMEEVEAILECERTFGGDDWKAFAREIQYPLKREFYYYIKDEATGLADPSRVMIDPDRVPAHNRTLGYRLSKFVHDQVFTPGKPLHALGQKIYSSTRDPSQGPRSLRVLEHLSKVAMFRCKDCGDCSLPEIAFLCPESQCAKNQRNGPCGGTRDGKCEVHDFECVWSRAYDRLKADGNAQHLLDHAPVIQDESLRGTSSWANSFLERDHTAKRLKVAEREMTGNVSTDPGPSNASPKSVPPIGEPAAESAPV